MGATTTVLVCCCLMVTTFAQRQECLAAPESRQCTGYQDNERRFFDQSTGSCNSFNWDTCTTGENSFNSWEDCEHKCVCQMPPAPVACSEGQIRYESPYYFNVESSKCEPFDGECSSNGNFYDSESSCKMSCVCSLPQEAGTGNNPSTAYYYDQQSQSCSAFEYSGAGGNANRFESESDCKQQCLCGLPRKPDSGPTCLAYMPSYFYNNESGTCEFFVYGGCGGNNNRFGSAEQCQQACGNQV